MYMYILMNLVYLTRKIMNILFFWGFNFLGDEQKINGLECIDLPKMWLDKKFESAK